VFEEVEAVASGEHEVEDDEVEVVWLLEACVGAGLEPGDAVVGFLEGVDDGGAEFLVVFDEEDVVFGGHWGTGDWGEAAVLNRRLLRRRVRHGQTRPMPDTPASYSSIYDSPR